MICFTIRLAQKSSIFFRLFWEFLKMEKKYSIRFRVNMKICITKSSWCNKKRIDSSFFIKKNIIGQSTFRHIINFCWDCKKKFKLKKIHSFQNKFQHIYHHVSNVCIIKSSSFISSAVCISWAQSGTSDFLTSFTSDIYFTSKWIFWNCFALIFLRKLYPI